VPSQADFSAPVGCARETPEDGAVHCRGGLETLLANLLPGLRELRTPLAVGATWLAAAWVLLVPLIPTREAASGVLLDVYRLFDQLGHPAAASLAAFVAYLVGSLSMQERIAEDEWFLLDYKLPWVLDHLMLRRGTMALMDVGSRSSASNK
jgi:hypothetical protein